MGFASLLLTVVSFVIGLQFPAQTDASDNFPLGCILEGITYPDGHLTSPDRCLRYQCINGDWKYERIVHPNCHECSSSGKTSIKMYLPHGPGIFAEHSELSRSYNFNGSAGPYSFTQKGLKTSTLGVETTFKYTDGGDNENSITHVLYKELGITVEFISPGPNQDAKILIDGDNSDNIPLSHDGSMLPYNSSVGTVYISNDSPGWPRPISGGNIHIVGSQGFAVSIYALNGYAWFVHAYAMPSLDDHIYGLCDVYRQFHGILPDSYTMRNGSETTNLTEFIESWKVHSITEDRSAEQESTVHRK